jgi:hypothetical protein
LQPSLYLYLKGQKNEMCENSVCSKLHFIGYSIYGFVMIPRAKNHVRHCTLNCLIEYNITQKHLPFLSYFAINGRNDGGIVEIGIFVNNTD